MINKLFLLVLACANIYCLPLDKQEVDIETGENDPVISKMYAKEIEQGDNAEEPLRDEKKHHKANKKHLHGTLIGPLHHGHGGHHVPIGLPMDEGLHGYGHDMHHIGYGAPHIGHMGHHGHVTHRLPGHGSPLPIIFPHERHHPHHHHSHHHAAHFGYPEYMPLPYAMPMCVMEKDDDDKKKKDDKKKDDKKKDDKKKSKRQLVPCHYYGPPSAGWGAYTPGWTGGGWGAPFWY